MKFSPRFELFLHNELISDIWKQSHWSLPGENALLIKAQTTRKSPFEDLYLCKIGILDVLTDMSMT
jgi:hypothetical protein